MSPFEIAATQLEVAIRETEASVAGLADALERMALALAAIDHAPQTGASEALRREISACVRHLQFHDRLTQQVVQVREYLAACASIDAGADDDAWSVLRRRLRSRLVSEAQRTVFDLLLASGSEEAQAVEAPCPAGDEGSIELF